ncbi:MAG: hypothetical protein ACYC3I_13185 [Gemmataceae bacterium]
MQVVHLRQLHEKYGGRAQFLFVYIREAGHMFPVSLPEATESDDAPLDPQLHLVNRVRAGIKHFGLRFPCLLDNEHEEIQRRYSAYPKRMLVVDPAGRIVVDSGNSPRTPFPWKETTDWLDRYEPRADY